MRLVINGTSIGITHMGRDFILVESPADYPAGEASILMKVDQNESHWQVRLPEGISTMTSIIVRGSAMAPVWRGRMPGT